MGFTVSKWTRVTVRARPIVCCHFPSSPLGAAAPCCCFCHLTQPSRLKPVKICMCLFYREREESLNMNPVWGERLEPPSSVWYQHIVAERLIETIHSNAPPIFPDWWITQSLYHQTLPVRAFSSMHCLLLPNSPKVGVWNLSERHSANDGAGERSHIWLQLLLFRLSICFSSSATQSASPQLQCSLGPLLECVWHQNWTRSVTHAGSLLRRMCLLDKKKKKRKGRIILVCFWLT